jgi:chloramphenicol-sensitive protein RarD
MRHYPRPMRAPDDQPKPNGLPMALGAYVIWGLLPLYLILVKAVPPFEFVGWRVVFSLPLCLLIVSLRKQWGEIAFALANRRVMLLLCASATMIGLNWLVYIAAVQEGHVLAASLGYFINPLVNVLFGTLLLKERLRALQWVAVALALVGVSLLAWGAREMLWISLTLATSFSLYGLIRKLTPIGSLPGLTIETGLLLLPALGIVGWFVLQPGGSVLAQDPGLIALTALSGVLTAVPLLLFAIAARRMSYTALAFVQFLSPTMVFLLGLFVFGEPLRQVQLLCFLAIWVAVALFVLDMLRASRRAS